MSLEQEDSVGYRHWTEKGCSVGLVHQVTGVTLPLNSVSKMCDAGNIVAFTAHGGTTKTL